MLQYLIIAGRNWQEILLRPLQIHINIHMYLIVIEIAKREHVTVTAWDYFKVGFPLTILTIVIAVLWLTIFGE